MADGVREVGGDECALVVQASALGAHEAVSVPNFGSCGVNGVGFGLFGSDDSGVVHGSRKDHLSSGEVQSFGVFWVMFVP